jgi:DNA-directed RNA polymerase subunit RPC12/RpoP
MVVTKAHRKLRFSKQKHNKRRRITMEKKEKFEVVYEGVNEVMAMFDGSTPETTSQYECRGCGELVDEIMTISETQGWHCSSCWHRTFAECNDCAEAFFKEDLRNGLCDDCFQKGGEAMSEGINQCECLERGNLADEIMIISDIQGWHCSSCWHRTFAECKDCGEVFFKEDLQNGLCDDCR